MDQENVLVNNWIVLTLTNVNPSASSTATLFKNPNSAPLSSAVSSGQGVLGLVTADFGNPFKISYRLNDISYVDITPSIANIDDLVSYINALFQATANPCCSYLEPSAGVYNVYSFSSVYTLMKIEANVSGPVNAVNLGLSVINGSFVDVQLDGVDLTYNELCSELMYQPYKLEWANIYANNVEQANRPFNLNDREANGRLYEKQLNPALSPMNVQYVNENIPLEFLTSSTNELQYTLGPAQSVRVIFGYTNKDLIALPEKEIFVPKTEIPELPKILVQYQSSLVPMLEIIKKQIYRPDGNFIKKIIKPFLKERAITKQEVYSAFNGYDFKECEDSHSH